MNPTEFVLKLKEKGIVLNETQIKQFHDYYLLLKKWNDIMNLTTIIEEEKVYEKHFYDSLTVAFEYDFSNKKMLDIGTGAGFPSIPLKIVFPSLKLTAMDSVTKKMKFIEDVVKNLDLKDVTIVPDRAESYIVKHREEFDVVTARAVARLNILMELAAPYLKVGGHFIALKGAGGQEEYHEAREASELLHLNLYAHQEIELPEEKSSRHNYFYVKTEKTNPRYPRAYNKIKQSPLKKS